MQRDGGDKIMAQVLNCVTSHGLPEVLVAVEQLQIKVVVAVVLVDY
jgi:hypothetical protein